MNKNNLKRYAPQARKNFIAAVTARANLLGLSERGGTVFAEPCEVQGDVALIGGRPWPADVQARREPLLRRMRREGFAHTLEAVAYTWFNRFAALRFMELHDYLGHGRRVLSNPEGGLPEVLAHALTLSEDGSLPGLKAETVRDLKLANQDGELYRLVLIAQCNALHTAMPFLFEHIADETELLLPDNLLLSDAVVAKLVAEIPEEDWAEVESIGWLYQFYISEKKDAVIGKVVASDDIPAATQLFTPNWIVQYLVQNSVGRLWLMANPDSALASQWPYYIQPAQQTPEVQAQLDALILTRMAEDGGTLNPESITVLDPACGSGHILVVAYDVLKAIYLERGYQPRAIPRLILEKNLFGLDIDDRAAQLAGFALLMRARADDRRLLVDPPKLNVLSLQESKGMDVSELATHLLPFGLQRTPLKLLLETFEHAKTFGSLIQIPPALNGQLASMAAGLQQALRGDDLYAHQAAKELLPMVWQALVLGMQFDAVAANPPYMGSAYFDVQLKKYINETYRPGKADLIGCFLLRISMYARQSGFFGLITIQNWMFISSFEELRGDLATRSEIINLVHNGRGVWGSDFGSCMFISLGVNLTGTHVGLYRRLFEKHGSVSSVEELRERFFDAKPYYASKKSLSKVPGVPLAYWLSETYRDAFLKGELLGLKSKTAVGLNTGDNARFLRGWHEVNAENINFDAASFEDALASGSKWFPYAKGGAFRKWYGNTDLVIDWSEDGKSIKDYAVVRNKGKHWSRYIQNLAFMFRGGFTWSFLSAYFGVRRLEPGSLFDVLGSSIFPEEEWGEVVACFLCSNVAFEFLRALNPTVAFQAGNIASLPLLKKELLPSVDQIKSIFDEAYCIAKEDWDSDESSAGFSRLAWLPTNATEKLAANAWRDHQESKSSAISRMIELETINNLIFSRAYGLENEISPDVSEDQVTLERANLEKDCRRLISYGIGCVMGRYSLDGSGLMYAHAGNAGFDPSRYERRFPADADGIVPLTEEFWFADDAASRVSEFLCAVWGPETLGENMAWLAASLGPKASETPEESIRRYLADKFFKDHLQAYKKRPIYWLFSSGKQGAFQALVYLHRYHEGTLARMRSEYVVPLTVKMQARIEALEADVRAAVSTAARTKLNKQLEALRKKLVELLAYDEKLRHHADQRITLDLDDGVKVNYGKFGDLLAEVKAVTGGKDDE